MGVGDHAKAEAFDTTIVNGRSVDLIHGEHPHSRSDDDTYARFKGRDSGGIVGFRGHRHRLGVTIEEYNYLKTSDLSGDEVRKGCKAVISIDGRDVYTVQGRDLLGVLMLVPGVLQALEGISGYAAVVELVCDQGTRG